MSTKTEKDKTKQLQDKCQSVINGLLRDEDNKYCVDCDSKGPRWASWNIGVFLCIRCAGIHRNLGVHISKVKSVNLDAWTPEQVVSLQQMGNSRARAVYEANLPDNFRRPQIDSALETFIRAKYEHKKYIAREWVPPTLPKVNWEKEIDDEIEHQKRKKKANVEKKSIGEIKVPQLPKPKNPSPKPNRIVAEKETISGDLLGLQNGDDSFGGFVSSAPEPAPKTAEADAKAEEASFFNQTAPTEKEKLKLTKDSILALYGSAPNANLNQFATNFPVNSNFGAFQQPQQGYQWGQFGAVAPAGQFSQFPGQFGQFQGAQFGQQPFGGAPFAHQTGHQQQQQQQNPFFGNQNNSTNLQQQFGNLSVANQAPGKPVAPTMASNIWQ